MSSASVPDRDDEGTAGFKELLWHLAQTELQVRVVPPEIAASAGKATGRYYSRGYRQVKGVKQCLNEEEAEENN